MRRNLCLMIAGVALAECLGAPTSASIVVQIEFRIDPRPADTGCSSQSASLPSPGDRSDSPERPSLGKGDASGMSSDGDQVLQQTPTSAATAESFLWKPAVGDQEFSFRYLVIYPNPPGEGPQRPPKAFVVSTFAD